MTTSADIEPSITSELRRRDRATRVAVEELTGLALQERSLITLLRRKVAEAPLGGPRERVERHLAQSREHAELFAERARALQAHRGGGELFAGLFRSSFAGLGALASIGAQVVTLPLALARRGGGEERLLENVGVEGGALANKLIILTAVTQALELSGDQESHAALKAARDQAQQTWDELLEQTPELMTALVRARSHEPSYDFRTTGGRDRLFDRLGLGSDSRAFTTPYETGRQPTSGRKKTAAKNGTATAR